jgi:uncharacterized Rmd1/YagE family protein
MQSKIHAYQVAEFISIKSFKQSKPEKIFYSDTDELFYAEGKDRYLYVFKYGAVCFIGYTEKERKAAIKEALKYARNELKAPIEESFMIKEDKRNEEIGFHSISVKKWEPKLIQLIMLNVTQSVALDYYSELAEFMLEDTRKYTNQLETRGRIRIGQKNLKKYIGKTLNLKNRISESLYILDAPPATWEDEYLDKIDIGLKKTFDIQNRYNEISDDISIIKENLELFKDLMQHRELAILEIIIILLILVEVVDVMILKFL